MFNPLRTEDLIAGMGRTMRAAADDGSGTDYARGQLLSAYSVSRLLAAEVQAGASLFAWLRRELCVAMEDSDDELVVSARVRIEAAADPLEIGAVITGLLADLRVRPREDGVVTKVHAILSEMASRELAALAATSAGPAGTG